MNELELNLLQMWLENGIREIYKYKNRIKAFREPLSNFSLFTDLTSQMFSDVEDMANHQYSSPEEHKVSVEELLNKRTRIE